MESLIYSLNATVPVFLVIVVGYVLKQIGMLNDNFIEVANKFNFKVTLPILLLTDIGSTNIIKNFDGKYILFCAVVTSICFWSIWFFTKKFMKDSSMTGAFVQASFRGSAAILGIAFVQNIYGNAGMAPMMIIGAVPLYNIYSVIVLTFESEDSRGGNDSIKKACINIIKNPIIIGILLGMIVSLLNIHFPKIIDKTLKNFAVMASPLALVTIGAGFEGTKALAKIKPTLAASFIKLVAQAAVFLPLAVYFGFRDQELVALIIMLGSPTTVSCYIMAKNMNNDGVLTSSVVVATTLLSAFTLTFWIFVLKSFKFII
ncbi:MULTISPECIES: AEC family transporter [Clostridium]|uniref:AEC family transporter n=3 Tax=Clostridium TaxID=1485 RepID=A0A3M0SW39_9CLOT|nr:MULTISPECIES: AEC family transporter [Clostridium]ADK14999.1 putative permease [Clostridium ljungdahlii DSM 13528]AGY74251.1 AEC family transporter [Clostridium autoethanogenum DSM 10061]ALU34442.1 Transmembrane permease [Clostridium autoethanogenum DSM 10061]OAA87660.1 putative transporter YfdV [Clostridium ljungdahlii DSM 13528]OVY51162.1 putative transporter YfdV [Clostridium autoethanogenum]